MMIKPSVIISAKHCHVLSKFSVHILISALFQNNYQKVLITNYCDLTI